MASMEEHHWWFQGTRAVLLDVLDRSLAATGSKPDDRLILDLGAGTGHTTRQLGRRGRVVAVDRSPLALRLAAASGRGVRPAGPGAQLPRPLCADGARLPLRDGVVDALCAFDVLEHLDDDRAALAEIARVLRPQGLALISVPAHAWLWSAHDEALGHRRRYRRKILRRRILDAGLQLERLGYYNAALFPAAALYRAARSGLRRVSARHAQQEPSSDLQLPPAPLNRALAAVLAAERFWLRWTPGLPFGLSLIALARRP